MNIALRNPHFIRFPRAKPAKMRLFCLPYAGGDGTVFRHMPALINESIEVVGVEYPGRGRLFADSLINNVNHLADILLDSIRSLLDLPFAIYGHSNGALVAYELTRRLSTVLLRDPQMLFIAAKASPSLSNETPISQLPTDAFIQILRSYQGTPDIIFENQSLLDVYLPVLRADFALGETYKLGRHGPLNVPACLIAGAQDAVSPARDVAAWASLFRNPPQFHTVPGGHFFMNTHAAEVAKIINLFYQSKAA